VPPAPTVLHLLMLQHPNSPRTTAFVGPTTNPYGTPSLISRADDEWELEMKGCWNRAPLSSVRLFTQSAPIMSDAS
jgi:hypothetical protein